MATEILLSWSSGYQDTKASTEELFKIRHTTPTYGHGPEAGGEALPYVSGLGRLLRSWLL